MDLPRDFARDLRRHGETLAGRHKSGVTKHVANEL
jgi:hypothetical protein